MEVKNFFDIPKEEQTKFINSFDQIMFDIDGVILAYLSPILGAPECVRNLQKLGKAVHYVTNNSIMSTKDIAKSLMESNFDTTTHDIVNPIEVNIAYLTKQSMKNNIYLISNNPHKDALEMAGFNILPEKLQIIEENTNALFEHFDSNLTVGAVIYDFDFNTNYVQLQKALWYLQNNSDCIFLVTLNDKVGPTGPRGCLLGPNIFIETLKNLSGKDFIQVGKPSEACVNFIKEIYHVTDPKRVLFVGDSIESDMSTGALGGFQKMLVLTGSTKMEDITNWQFPEEYKPEYFVESLEVLNKIIKSIFPNL
ncbi:uncharacterized protein [Diabrotica undecimpunctata]|uniref:uncharacterized protein n=1 Tax=Diabrotica undecimpunctata TaxID=50387 RepID=UPI003B640238